MTRSLIMLLLASGLLTAQTPVVAKFGGLYCAAVLRTPQVQTYCYTFPAAPTWNLVHNKIDSPPANVTYNYPPTSDTIVWGFTTDGTSVQWEYSANRGPLQTGIFGPLSGARCVGTLCTITSDESRPDDMAIEVGDYPAGVSGPAKVNLPAGSLTTQFTVSFSGSTLNLNPSITNWTYANRPEDPFRFMAEPVFRPTVWMGG